MATVLVCMDDPAPALWADCVSLVQAGYALPFELSETVLANLGEAFAAGFFIVTAFWGLGYGASYVIDVIKRA